MPQLGSWEILILLGVLVLLFGATRLPKAAEGIGKALKVFKREVKTNEDDGSAKSAETPAEPKTQQINSQANGTPAEAPTVTHQEKK